MSTQRDVVVIGAGGLGREIMDCLCDLPDQFRLLGVLDDEPRGRSHAPHLGPASAEFIPVGAAAIIGVGETRTRLHIVERLGEDVIYQSIIHPSAYVSTNATIGAGVFVSPFAYVGHGSRVGHHVVLNVYASVGHDAVVGDYCVLSPYATLNGHAEVGQGGFLGTYAGVGVGVEVGAWSRIAAGTVAARSCEVGTLVSGNPPKSRVLFRPPNGG